MEDVLINDMQMFASDFSLINQLHWGRSLHGPQIKNAQNKKENFLINRSEIHIPMNFPSQKEFRWTGVNT